MAYASYVTTNHWLYNFTRIATLLVGGASALSGAITPEQLTTFVLCELSGAPWGGREREEDVLCERGPKP